MKSLVLSVLSVAQFVTAAPQSPSEPIQPNFKASPSIKLNREIALKEGITPNEIFKQVQTFYEANNQFTLEQLNNLGIKTSDGRTVKLSQLASVEVVFHKETQNNQQNKSEMATPRKPSD